MLLHGKTHIWDSLAICEYIHELDPDKNLWPQDAKARAIARSYVAEMHSGFTSLRSQLSMDISLRTHIKHLAPQTLADIARIVDLWEAALGQSGGPYLFGSFGIADAFYAPVVFRFLSYGIDIRNARCRKYMNTVVGTSFVKDWVKSAKKERFLYPKF